MLKNNVKFVNRFVCFLMIFSGLFIKNSAYSATTTDIMNAMSACGGSTLSITNNTKEKVGLQLEQGVATGEVIQRIVPKLVESILGTKDSPLYDKYVSCMTQILSKGATVEDRQRALLADLSVNVTDSAIRHAFGPPTKEVRGPRLITRLYEGSFASFYVIKNQRNQLYAIAVFAPNEGKPSDVPIPFLHAAFEDPQYPLNLNADDQPNNLDHLLEMNNLEKLSVTNIIRLCGDDVAANDVSVRHWIFVTTPCSIGSAGQGREFYFGFNTAWHHCQSKEKHWNPLDWPKKLPLKKLNCESFKKMSAEFVFIPILDCKQRCVEIANAVYGDKFWGDQYSDLDRL